VYELTRGFLAGTLTARLNSATDPLVNPATIDRFGDWIYAVRRDSPAPAPAAYHLTRIAIPQTDEQGEHESGGSD
jgi:hypothetical protein